MSAVTHQPDSTHVTSRIAAKVAVAATTTVRHGLAWEWDQIDLTPESWRIDLGEADLVLVEVDGEAVRNWPSTPTAIDIAAAARARGIVTAAWLTVPDPLPESRRTLVESFDAVFVTDDEQAATWQAHWPHSRIGTLPPATQPRVHSPSQSKPGTGRSGHVVVLIDTADIAQTAPDDHVGMMSRSRQQSVPVVDIRERDSGHDADTTDGLFARYRVFADVGARAPGQTWPVLDALASGAAVVTTQERSNHLPADIRDVVDVAQPHELRRSVSVRARQAELRDREALVARRAVLNGHTFADRARALLEVAGVEVPHHDRSVSVVVPTNRPHELTNVLENVARQVRASVELIIVGHGIDIDRKSLAAEARDLGVHNLTVITAGEDLTLGAVMNRGIDAVSGQYVAKMDDDNYYGPHYLGDLLDTFSYTDAGIAGKWAHYVWLRSTNAVVLRFQGYEHTYNRLVQGGSIVARRDVVDDLRFSDIPRAIDSDFLNRCMAAGVRTYSGDRFNFVSIRGSDRTNHTWKIDDLVLMSGDGQVVTFGDPRALVSA